MLVWLDAHVVHVILLFSSCVYQAPVLEVNVVFQPHSIVLQRFLDNIFTRSLTFYLKKIALIKLAFTDNRSLHVSVNCSYQVCMH